VADVATTAKSEARFAQDEATKAGKEIITFAERLTLVAANCGIERRSSK
jgi:hypothetical protein